MPGTYPSKPCLALQHAEHSPPLAMVWPLEDETLPQVHQTRVDRGLVPGAAGATAPHIYPIA